MIWVTAVREQNPPREADYGQAISIAVTPPPPGLIPTNEVEDDVNLRLLAPERSWSDISPNKFKAWVDLSGLETGLSDVPVQLEVADSTIQIIEQQPRVISVNLEPLKTITLPVEINILDNPPLGYVNRSPTATPSIVKLTGPVSQIDQVTKAVVDTFIRNAKETVQNVETVAVRDEDNRIVFGVTVEPAEVQVIIPVQQRFGYKDVPVRVQVTGQVAPGYRISNISVDPPTITVVGSPEGLSQLSSLVETVPINLEQATETIARTVPLSLPDGVTTVSSETGGPGGVQVLVEITPIEDAITVQRPITQQGIDPDSWWRASPTQADVYLSGPLSRLRSLQASDVEVLVDLFDLEPGVHILQPAVFKPDGLRLDAILPDTIEVTIGRTVERPIIASDLDPAYSWTASPKSVAVRIAGNPEQLRRLQPSDVRVTVGLAGLDPGLYQLVPDVAVPNDVTVDSTSPERVTVIITAKSGLVISPTITGTSTITAVP
jgi:YbbR domain-containing protein